MKKVDLQLKISPQYVYFFYAAISSDRSEKYLKNILINKTNTWNMNMKEIPDKQWTHNQHRTILGIQDLFERNPSKLH